MAFFSLSNCDTQVLEIAKVILDATLAREGMYTLAGGFRPMTLAVLDYREPASRVGALATTEFEARIDRLAPQDPGAVLEKTAAVLTAGSHIRFLYHAVDAKRFSTFPSFRAHQISVVHVPAAREIIASYQQEAQRLGLAADFSVPNFLEQVTAPVRNPAASDESLYASEFLLGRLLAFPTYASRAFAHAAVEKRRILRTQAPSPPRRVTFQLFFKDPPPPGNPSPAVSREPEPEVPRDVSSSLGASQFLPANPHRSPLHLPAPEEQPAHFATFGKMEGRRIPHDNTPHAFSYKVPAGATEDREEQALREQTTQQLASFEAFVAAQRSSTDIFQKTQMWVTRNEGIVP